MSAPEKQIEKQKAKEQSRWEGKQIKEILRHLMLARTPLLLAAIMDEIWYICHVHHFYFQHESADLITTGALCLPALFYGVFGGLVVAFAAKKNSIITASANRIIDGIGTDADCLAYMEYKDRHIHPASHLMLGTLATFMVSAFMFLDYGTDIPCGLFMVGGATFLAALMREVTNEFDNPFAGIDYLKISKQDLDNLIAKKKKEWRDKNGHNEVQPEVASL